MSMKKSQAGMLTVFVLGTLCMMTTSAYGAKKPILAVFDIEVRVVKMNKRTLDAFRSFLQVRIVQSGAFQAVPSSKIKKLLRLSKAGSYKTCYDTKCQIEVGRELAASHALNTQIIGIGSQCLVLASVYDLRTATSTVAASRKGGCTKSALLSTLGEVVDELGGSPGRQPSATPTGPTMGGIYKKQVSCANYRRCVQSGGCTPTDSSYPCKAWEAQNEVTWYQARAYCKWRGHRLPSAEEFRKASTSPDFILPKYYEWVSNLKPPALRVTCKGDGSCDGSDKPAKRNSITGFRCVSGLAQ